MAARERLGYGAALAAMGVCVAARIPFLLWGEPGAGACFRLTLPLDRKAGFDHSPLPLDEVVLPPGARIGALVRGPDENCEVLMPHHVTVIEPDDHLIVFIPSKKMVREVERLFQVSATFI